MIQITYILSTLFLLMSIIIYKKTDNKINLLKFITILMVVFLSYNSLVCYILNLINIPITLETLSIINCIIGILLSILILRKKEIQHYEIGKKDILVFFIILLVVIIALFLNFGRELHIKYLTTDAGVHFKAAREFYQNDKLLNKTENTSIPKEFMLGAYTNTGILFKVVEPVIGEINLYRAFIAFDVFIYFMIGMVMYSLTMDIIKTKLGCLLSVICIIVFMIGYPLNSLIFGYVYLQLGILIILTILMIYKKIERFSISKLDMVFLLTLNFSLFFTYCIFVPIVYLAEGLYFLIQEYKNKKRPFTIDSIKIIAITLVIPFVLGIIYFAIPHIMKENGQFFLTIEGYIYRNIWSNFLFVLPLSLVYIIKKKSKISFDKILFTILIIYMLFMLLITYSFKLSTYYYFKNNFLLWAILWGCSIYGINILIEDNKNRLFVICYLELYVAFMLIAILFKRVPITKSIYTTETILDTFDIYCINRTIIQNVEVDYEIEEIELLNYIKNNLKLEKNKILILGNPRQEFWFDGIFEYSNRENLETLIPYEHIKKWNNNQEFKYLLILYRSYAAEKYKDLIEYKIKLFENEYGAIYSNY